mmetsp:Transcript_63662/g.201322  ORF Transcript_63662/g.201322 Transcript_63662/m.201322 type:complete len:254 (+) Transcript_63662:348-1109(+)
MSKTMPPPCPLRGAPPPAEPAPQAELYPVVRMVHAQRARARPARSPPRAPPARVRARHVAGVAEVRRAEAEPRGHAAAEAALVLYQLRAVRWALGPARARAACAAHEVLPLEVPPLLVLRSPPGLARPLPAEVGLAAAATLVELECPHRKLPGAPLKTPPRLQLGRRARPPLCVHPLPRPPRYLRPQSEGPLQGGRERWVRHGRCLARPPRPPLLAAPALWARQETEANGRARVAMPDPLQGALEVHDMPAAI